MKSTFTLFFLLLVIVAYGQINQTERIELPFKYSDENYLVVMAEEQGIILFRESSKHVNRKESWEVMVLDTLLEETINLNVEVNYKYTFMGYEYNAGDFYLLFNDKSTAKSKFLLSKISLENGSIDTYEIENELKMDVSHLIINSQSIVLGGYINYRATFVVFDYINDKVKVVPGFFSSKSEVLDFNYDEHHQSYNVLMGQRNAINHNEIALKSFGHDGQILVDVKYELNQNWRALNGRMIIGSNDKIIVSGSFADNNSYFSQGYYFGSLAPGDHMKMEYIGFAELDHFFDYMNPKRAMKMKKRVLDAKIKNKSFDYKSQVYVHELKQQSDQYLITSELYKPEFKESSSPLGYNSAADKGYRDKTAQKYVTRSSKLTKTEGASHISYYESVILGVDLDGKLLWDRSMSLIDAETLSLEQVAKINNVGNEVISLYKKDHNISYHTFDLTSGMEVDSTLAIDTFEEFDEVKMGSERQGKVEYWYDNKFVIWGYQKINNPRLAAKDERRNIFFINKLVIE
jgi:hypothetical protein